MKRRAGIARMALTGAALWLAATAAFSSEIVQSRGGYPARPASGERYRFSTWQRRDIRRIIPKGYSDRTLIEREYTVVGAERERLATLLEEGKALSVLAPNEEDRGALAFSPAQNRMTAVGIPERIAVLRTLIVDREAFDAYRAAQEGKTPVTMVAIIDPLFLEYDPDWAESLALINFDGVRRLLGADSNAYRRSEKRAWYVRTTGVAVILDTPESVERCLRYIDRMPYGLKKTTYSGEPPQPVRPSGPVPRQGQPDPDRPSRP